MKWPLLSSKAMTANAVQIQLHGLAYYMFTFMRTLAPRGEM